MIATGAVLLFPVGIDACPVSKFVLKDVACFYCR